MDFFKHAALCLMVVPMMMVTQDTTEALANANCVPYNDTSASLCSSDHQRTVEFTSLDQDMDSAQTYEQLPDFVLHTTMSMYLFLHPCMGNTDAAKVLFYHQNASGGVPLNAHRKRRDNYLTDDDLLQDQLTALVRQTTAGCVQFLIDKYINTSATRFKLKHPNFLALQPTVPSTTTTTTTNTTPPSTTTSTTTTTTAAERTATPVTASATSTGATAQSNAATATSNATTATAIATATSNATTATAIATSTSNATAATSARATESTTVVTSMSTAARTSQSAESTTTTTTTFSPLILGPITCSSCSGLLCLVGNHVTQCPDDHVCQTTVAETDTGRQITRGCSSQELCRSFQQHQNQTLCSRADWQILPSGSTCRFCCVTRDCNQPPHVIPPAHTLFLG